MVPSSNLCLMEATRNGDSSIRLAWTSLTIDFANGKGYMSFRTPDQFLYEHLFLNYNLTPSGMQDSQRKIGIEKIMEMFRRIPSIKIPKDRIPEKLLAEYEKRVNQENEEKNDIVDFLNTTIQSGENALILINEEKEKNRVKNIFNNINYFSCNYCSYFNSRIHIYL